MSFVKLPRKYPAKPQHGSRTGKARKKKPEWDDSVNDLSVHRASADELIRRKVVTTSKNLDAVKEDQMRRRISKAVARDQAARTRPAQNAFLKEVLYDNAQLHEVLAKSDRMMSVVKDLFGDDPMKYRGAPNVTLAPEQSSVNGSLPNMELGPSKLDMLSESVMDRTALNTDGEEDASYMQEVEYEPAVDVERFQRLLELASEEDARQQQGGERLTHSMADTLLHQLAAKLGLDSEDPGDRSEEDDDTLESPRLIQQQQNKAMNDTIKVQKSRSRLTAEERAASPQLELAATNTSADMNDLRKVLDGLERNIGEYEKMIGREPTVATSGDDSLSGFTSRLVNAVNKITRYMRENEVRLRAEVTLREQLHLDVLFLRQLVDTLTNDIMITQEQYITLQSEFAKYKKHTTEEIHNIKQCLEAAGVQLHRTVMPTPQLPQPAFSAPQPPSKPAFQTTQPPTNHEPQPAFQTAPTPASHQPHPAFQSTQPMMTSLSQSSQSLPSQHPPATFQQPPATFQQASQQATAAIQHGTQSQIQMASGHIHNQSLAQSLNMQSSIAVHAGMNTAPSFPVMQQSMSREQAPLKQPSVNLSKSQPNAGALFAREHLQMPQMHNPVQQQPRPTVALPSANQSMNALSGAGGHQNGSHQNEISGKDRLPAVPLNVPIQSHSPTLPEKRAPLMQRNQPVPVCPQPAFSQEPQRAASHRDHGHMHEDVPRAVPMAMLAEDEEVSELQHSVQELQQAINKEEMSLEEQIQALQQQHEDAQQKLQLLMQHGQAADHQRKAPVSPAISPITVESESHVPVHQIPVPIVRAREPAPQPQKRSFLMHTKEIKVSLPRADLNESADRSQTSER